MNSSPINFNDPTVLYEQIISDIKKKIEAGVLVSGDRIGSQLDLSIYYCVSLITIKKALSVLISEGVLFTRTGKGTYVAHKKKSNNQIAFSKTIGLVLTDLKHPYFSYMIYKIEQRAYELGYNIMLSGSSGDIGKEENQIANFKAQGVDGLIIASLSFEYKASDYIQELHKEGFPYLMVSYIHDPEYWYVGTDHELGGFLATEHLINIGYKSIGYVHVGKGNLLSEVRKNGYTRALTEYGLPYNSEQIFQIGLETKTSGIDRYNLGYFFGKKFPLIENKPDALFMYNDMLALGFIKAVTEEGFKIPEDIAVVGFDDLSISKFSLAPLTTIHQPIDRIGKLAVEILDKRIQKTDVGNRTILKPELVIRKSCGAAIKEIFEPTTN